jgi:hypothetical protein
MNWDPQTNVFVVRLSSYGGAKKDIVGGLEGLKSVILCYHGSEGAICCNPIEQPVAKPATGFRSCASNGTLNVLKGRNLWNRRRKFPRKR